MPPIARFVGLSLLAILLLIPVTVSASSSASGVVPLKAHPPKTLTSPNAQTDGQFGYSIAAGSGLVVVGAPTESPGFKSDAGAAYVFNDTTGAFIMTLTSPNSQLDAEFGISVAVGTGIIVVGAPYETVSSLTYAGRAYVFDSSTGALVSTLVSPNAQASGYFGFSVGASGSTAVVGAFNEKASGLTQAGNAYTFKAKTGALLKILVSPGVIAAGEFGYSVAISGTTAVVGAPGETSGGKTVAGNTYAFNAKTGALISTMTDPVLLYDSLFGDAVAVSGHTAVVGAYAQDVAGAYSGSAYLYDVSTGGLIATLASATPQAYGYYGSAVAIGAKVVMVGAHGETAGGDTEAGKVYTYSPSTGALSATLTSPNEQGGGSFGFSVAASGKVPFVGAAGESVGSFTYAGHAYIF